MEPWLRPLQTAESRAPDELHVLDLLTSLEQAYYWLRSHIEAIPAEALWWEPAPNIPSIGTRLQHVIRSSKRLAAYALSPAPDYEALSEEAQRDWIPEPTSKEELLAELAATFSELRSRVEALTASALSQECFVGRRRIPVRRSAILHHIAEHAAYHAGQLILLLRLWQAQHRGDSNG
ncbi:MAG: DinB family protein [Chlorobiota bacterium]